MSRIEAPWISAAAPAAVMAALGEGYFVGGCVRNSLMGAPISDIDIATPLDPEEVQRRLTDAGIRAVATGLHHGTLTAVYQGEGIEVTTFRADVATDGRRATVQYTTDMAVDAARRDFTMNALYATADGEVIDPIGGLPDLFARRVRFIGRAEDRIREDYLRILRFFRFHAWYGGDGIDPDGLAACAALADGLDGLARERIGWEFRKLLGAPDPAPAVASMAATGILGRCLPGADPALLAPLVHMEAQTGTAPDWPTRLAIIGGENIAARLRLSRAEATAQSRIRAALAEAGPIVESVYRHGAEATRRAALIHAAMRGIPPDANLESELARGAALQFPLKAADLINAGWDAGPALGAALKAAEERWIRSGFSLDKATLLSEVRH